MKLFGTDGIRGKANHYPITADVALGLGKAFVTLISKGGKKVKVVIGRDTRISGSMLEEALIAGISSAGGDALPIGVVPSNAVSYFMGLKNCSGGIMISASHNPAEENGLKFFSSDGFKISEETEAEMEGIFFGKSFASAEVPGSAFRVRSVKEDYITFIADSLKGNDLSGLKIAVDAGNGSASYVVKDLFSELKAEATLVNNEPDGNNINEDCGALFPEQLKNIVKGKKLDAGVAFDGDADRLLMVDELGNIIDGDSLIAIAAVNLKGKNRLNKDTIVVTDYSNSGLDSSLAELGIKTVRVKTGDKHVSAELFKNDYSIGGENSGHIIIPEFSKTADAVLACVQILNVMKEQGKSLSELAAVVKKYPQVMVNVAVKEKKPIEEMPSVSEKIREGESRLEGSGRIFTRYSGTEKKLRILVEGKIEKEIKDIAESIESAVKEEIGA